MVHFTAWQVLLLSVCILNIGYSESSNCLRSALTCADLTFEGEIWGYDVSGLLIGEYTDGIQFIGCVDADVMFGNCQVTNGPNGFICFDNPDGSIYFGSNVGVGMVSLFDTGSIPDTDTGCATESNEGGFTRLSSHLPGGGLSIQSHTLCQQLGYEESALPAISTGYTPPACPAIVWNDVTNDWELDFDISADANYNMFYSALTCTDPCTTGSPTTQMPTQSTQNPSEMPTTAPYTTPIYTTGSASSDSDSEDSNEFEDTGFGLLSDSEDSEDSMAAQNALKQDRNWDEHDLQEPDDDDVITVVVRLDVMSCLGLILLVLVCCSAPFIWFFVMAKSKTSTVIVK